MGKSLKERASQAVGKIKKTYTKAKKKTEKIKKQAGKKKRKVKRSAKKASRSYGDALMIRDYKLDKANEIWK